MDQTITATTTVSGDEAESHRRKEQLQLKHYEILQQLQLMASELPPSYAQRLPNELLSQLASCMLDETIPSIVNGLQDIQRITEKSLYEKRRKLIDELNEQRNELRKKCKQAVVEKRMTPDEARQAENELIEQNEILIKQHDAKTIMELDQSVAEQQVTLERAGVPGFFITNKPQDIQLQMHILKLLLQIIDEFNLINTESSANCDDENDEEDEDGD